MTDHSYEEIRKAAIELLAGREEEQYTNNQYIHFRNNIATVLRKWHDGKTKEDNEPFSFSKQDDLYVQEVFWDLFRQGIITLGSANNPNEGYPWFRLSSYGKKVLDDEDPYFFHDLSSYENIILAAIPDIDELTLFYLKEAMQTFMVGCYLSSSVMLGVALEYSLNNLYQVIEKNPDYKDHFSKVSEEKTLLKRYNKFKNKLKEIQKNLPKETKEDLDTNLDMIVSLIRNYRNESGHPSGKVLNREQCYVNLQLFIPCCKRIYELRDFFREKKK